MFLALELYLNMLLGNDKVRVIMCVMQSHVHYHAIYIHIFVRWCAIRIFFVLLVSVLSLALHYDNNGCCHLLYEPRWIYIYIMDIYMYINKYCLIFDVEHE